MASRKGPVHVATTRRKYKDKVYETHLLRHSYREDGKVKNETVGNISHLPREEVEILRRSLQGERFFSAETLELLDSLAHGHAALVLGVLRDIGLDVALSYRRRPERDLVEAMITARIIQPLSKAATARWWRDTTIPELTGIGEVDEDDLYAALDWLVEAQPRIEKKLAKRYLGDGTLVLYDISSTRITGQRCPLAKRGKSRDHRPDLPQVVYGVITDRLGCPVAIEVFEGNTNDTTAVIQQIRKVKERFGLERLVFVGDRGMVRKARIPELREQAGVDWISALTSRELRKLVDDGVVQLGLFDEQNLMEVSSEDYPGERLMVCRNPLLAKERARKRNELLAATEARLEKIAAAVAAGRLTDSGKIGERLGRAWGRQRMRKHFEYEIGEGHFTYRRDDENIARESALDGFYVIRTSLPDTEGHSADDIVRDYKRLAQVERVFRAMKTTHLLVGPIRHWTEPRVRAHVFLCMLAAHVLWHLERRLEPLLFRDPAIPDLNETGDPVVPKKPSEEARRKCAHKRTADGHPIHSMATLLASMGSLRKQTVRLAVAGATTWSQLTVPSPWHHEVFRTAGLRLA